MTGVQTILSNQNVSVDVVTNTYTTEQRGSWSLDLIILETCNHELEITMEVSNDGIDWACFKIVKEKVHPRDGRMFLHTHLPMDYCRWVICSNSTSGRYKLLFNERS